MSDLCATRESPSFIPPNTEHVTLRFDYLLSPDLKLLDGTSANITSQGFLIEPQKAPEGFQLENQTRLAPKWSRVHEYSPQSTRLIVSGRALVQITDGPWLRSSNGAPSSVLAVCTRGAMKEQTVKTLNYSHTAQVVSSGVVFALFVTMSPSGLYLCPRVMLALENGDEVNLLDDRLGPVSTPVSFYCDFTIVDEGGRNVQLDIICRGLPQDPAGPPGEPTIGNMKTMLQDWTTVNNHVQPAYVSIGNSSLGTRVPNAAVYLQNLVISEEQFDEVCPGPEPFVVGQDFRQTKPDKILFEGVDALTLASKTGTPEAEWLHPQLMKGQRKPGLDATMSKDRFWYHIQYDDDEPETADTRQGRYNQSLLNRMTVIPGEFWLCKSPVDKKNVYFSCSSTMAQALTTCIAFRFTCPQVHLNLIAEGTRGAKVLRHEHIPTNGIVMGLERHPKHRDLIHMFVEHRNQVLDDMTVCECHPLELTRTIVYQEVFDGGNSMTYRLSILRSDGSRQAAALQVAVDQLEESVFDSSRNGQDTLGDLSPRFPIVPCLLRHNLPPENRIFVYSSVAYKSQNETGDDDHIDEFLSVDAIPSVNSEFTGMEDWKSVGGEQSDAEAGGKDGAKVAKGLDGDTPVEWRRPLVQSATILRRLEEPPIKCFPKSLVFH